MWIWNLGFSPRNTSTPNMLVSLQNVLHHLLPCFNIISALPLLVCTDKENSSLSQLVWVHTALALTIQIQTPSRQTFAPVWRVRGFFIGIANARKSGRLEKVIFPCEILCSWLTLRSYACVSKTVCCMAEISDQCTPPPCYKEGATLCVDGQASFKCECKPGWKGPRCENGTFWWVIWDFQYLVQLLKTASLCFLSNMLCWYFVPERSLMIPLEAEFHLLKQLNWLWWMLLCCWLGRHRWVFRSWISSGM